MTSWTDRLLAALDIPDPDDEPGTDEFDTGSNESAGRRAWERPHGNVADHVIVAALIGHPARADADTILADPHALAQLTRHWATTPPAQHILDRATHNRPLAELLAATSITGTTDGADQTKIQTGTTPASSTAPRAWEMTRSAYGLGAAVGGDRPPRVVHGDHVTVKIQRRDTDATATIELVYDPPLPIGPGPWIARITDRAAGPFHALVVLLPTSTDPTHLKGVLELPPGAGLGLPDQLSGTHPFPLEQLWTGPDRDADHAAATHSVTWTTGPYRQQWAQIAARLPPSHPYWQPHHRRPRPQNAVTTADPTHTHEPRPDETREPQSGDNSDTPAHTTPTEPATIDWSAWSDYRLMTVTATPAIPAGTPQEVGPSQAADSTSGRAPDWWMLPELTAPDTDATKTANLLRDLIGPNQTWLVTCRKAVLDPGSATAQTLIADDGPYLPAFAASPNLYTPSQTPGGSKTGPVITAPVNLDLQTARDIRDLARLISTPPSARTTAGDKSHAVPADSQPGKASLDIAETCRRILNHTRQAGRTFLGATDLAPLQAHVSRLATSARPVAGGPATDDSRTGDSSPETIRYQRLSQILDQLATTPDAAAAYAALLTCHLADALPPTAPHGTDNEVSATVPVLLTLDHQPHGLVGQLRLTLLPDGPPGIHFHPARMAFFTTPPPPSNTSRAVDQTSRPNEPVHEEEHTPDPGISDTGTPEVDFHTSAFNAWLSSPFAPTPTTPATASVLWDLTLTLTTDHPSPLNRLSGGSLGAATAIALHHLYTRHQRRQRANRPLLRPLTYLTDWAHLDPYRNQPNRKAVATATITTPAGTLGPVDRLTAKLAAAHTHQLNPVLIASANHHIADRLNATQGHGLDITPVRTVQDALPHTLQRNNPNHTRWLRLLAAGAVLVMLLVAATFVAVDQAGKSQIADRLRVSAQLAQKAQDLSTQDRRLSALAALASYRLDPSDQSLKAMSEVVRQNDGVLGARQISSGAILQMVASSDTLLVADAMGTISAWTLPQLAPLGSLAEGGDLEALGGGADNVFGLVQRGTLRIFQGGLGRRPSVIKEMAVNTTGGAYGPYFSDGVDRKTVFTFDKRLSGTEWTPGSASTFDFDLGGQAGLRAPAGNRPFEVVAAADTSTPGVVTYNDSWNTAQSVMFATNSNQLAALDVEVRGSGAKVQSRVRVRPLADIGTRVTSLLPLSATEVLVGTEDGVQHWILGKTPRNLRTGVGGTSGRVEDLGEFIAARFGDDRLAVARTSTSVRIFHLGPASPMTPADLSFGDRSLTSVALSPGIDRSLAAVGDASGRVAVLDPTNTRFGPPTYAASNIVAFGPRDHLLIAQPGISPNYIASIDAQAVPPAPAPAPGVDSSNTPPDPYEQATYALPAEQNYSNGTGYPYVNAAASSNRYIAAAGRTTSSRVGTIWIWNLSGKQRRSITFSAGPSATSNSFDVVSHVALTPTNQLVAYNPVLGQVGVWDAATLDQVGVADVGPVTSEADARASALTMSADGHTAVVRTPFRGGSKLTVLSLQPRPRVTTSFDESEVYGLSLSPDGSHLAVGLQDNSVKTLSIPSGATDRTYRLGDLAATLAYSPDGSKLAAAAFERGTITLLDSQTLTPTGPVWTEPNASVYLRDFAWSADSRWLAANAGLIRDGRAVPAGVRVISAGELDWQKALCNIAGDDLTTAEWKGLVSTDISKPRLCS